MIKLLSKTAILFLLSFISISGKNKETTLPQKGTQTLYLCMPDLGPSALAFAAANNIQIAKLVGQASIDPTNTMVIREDLLKANIIKLFPNPTDTGTGVLDWEGKGETELTTLPANDPEFQVILNKFIRVLQISKQLRPDVKWTYYGLPSREYWHMNSAWEQQNLRLIPLFKLCDLIGPSLYSPYSEASGKANEQAYVHNNMQLALKIGNMVNRPVCPFIWHRLPNLDLIPKEEFLRHVKAVLNESYNGTKPAGAIWWGSDFYFYTVKTKALVAEVGSKENFTSYHDKLIANYGSGIVQLLRR